MVFYAPFPTGVGTVCERRLRWKEPEMMNIRSLTFQVVALVAIPAFAAYHEPTEYNFTFSSFAREGVITLRTEGEATGTYELGEESTTTIQTPLFDRSINVKPLVDEGQLTGTETVRPIAYIPQGITLDSISIVTPGNTAPDILLLTLGGTTHRLSLADGTETVTLYGTDANGAVGTRSGVVHTYNVASGDSVTLNPGTEHTDFEVAFQSSDAPGQAQNRNVYLLDGRPYLRIAGKATLQHHIFKINAAANPDHTNAQSLATLLAGDASAYTFVDDPNTVIVVEFEGEGGGVSLDKEVLKSPIVFGSSVTPDKAHVHFPGTVRLESALTFRDGAEQGGISIYGPTDTANYEAARWNPSAMLLRCDLTLRTALPPLEGSWFLTHSTTIPAGRTFRLDLPSVTSEDNLPNLDFADATSRLELASSIGGQTLAQKYLDLLTTQSGTLVLDRDVSYSGSIAESNFMFQAAAPGLNTTIIQKSGTFTCGNFYATATGTNDENFFESFTFIQEGGTFNASGRTFIIEATQKRIQVGPTEGDGTATMTLASSPTLFEEGSTTVIDVAKGGTLTLGAGLDAGDADTTAALDLTVKGTLNLGADLNMTPALRRELRLEGGTIESTRYAPEVVNVICKDGTAAEADDFVIVSGGGTLAGALTVDGISGTSSETSPLIIDTGATVKDLRDFAGTVSGAGRLEAIEGTLGDVTLGDTWLANATGKKLGDVLTGWTEGNTTYHGAADFAGTIGFTAGAANAQKKLDFTDLDELTSLGMAFRINNHQHIVMRLDQYADAVIRWPDVPEGITLTLIESGAYGGELTLPHFPHTEGEETGVTFQFAYFNPDDPDGYTVRTEGYTHGHSEDGVNDTLTWDNPVFTGEGAWIDIEFNGDTRNTGWFTLGDYNGNPVTSPDQRNRYNGLLAGDEPYVVLEQTPTTTPSIETNHQANFTASSHPYAEFGSLPLHYRPYVALSSLEYPEAWTVSLRLSAPDAARTCILALGHNYTGTTAGIPKYEGDVYSLIFATGETSNEICLWVVPGLEGEGVSGTVKRPEAPAFTVTLADATTAQHTFSVICDGTTLNLYVDGAWLGEHALPGEGARLTNGLQVGVQLGGSSIPVNLETGFADAVGVEDGGSIDFLRFYKGAMPASAMVEVADRTPYVRENLRYVRYVPITTAPDGFTKTVPAGGETWIQPGAWQAETWNGSAWVAGDYFDQPAEGAECRLLVAPDEYTIQVNVERQVTGETDGDGQPVPENHYFYSPDRNYAALVLAPQAGQTQAGTLRLTPLGVTAKEAEDTGDATAEQPWAKQVIDSAWFTTEAPSTAGNRTGFRYGTLRFTGGASDPINDAGRIPNFYGAGYLLSGSGLNADAEVTTDTSERVYTPAEPVWADENITYTFETPSSLSQSAVASGTATQTATQTYSYTTTTITPPGYTVAPINGVYDAGVCYLSKHAPVVLRAAVVGGSTRVETYTGTRTWTRTASATREVEEHQFIITWYEPADPPNNRVAGAWSDASVLEETNPVLADDTTTEGEASQLNTLTMVAGRSLTRGETAEVMDWQLTGPVIVQGPTEPEKDYVLGHPALVVQDPDNDQASLDVWVPFFLGTDAWKFYDDTRTTTHGGEDNADGVTNGLFARGVQTPGRLYLDFTKGNKAKEGLFSQQRWYRYGYEGEAATETVSGMAPILASEADYEQAVAFQIRLSSTVGNEVTLTLDKLPTARVQTFHVEEAAGTTDPLTLKLTLDEGVDPLPIWDTVIAAARLDVSNGKTGLASDSSWEGNALSLRPEGNASTRRTPVHRGNASHGHGAYIVGTTQVDWDFGSASSVPRLEVIPGAELSFSVGQDFRTHGTTVVAQGKDKRTFPVEESDAGPTADDLKTAAWIHHMSGDPFLGVDVELGEGAIFGFHAEANATDADIQHEGVVLSGELRLTGNATLRADYNNVVDPTAEPRIPHFTAAGGICATKPGVTLIVDAPSHQIADGNENHVKWHSHTSKMTGEDFGLWKTGPGTVTFHGTEPPSVSGKVTVEEGTLAVTTATDTPIGAKGLHVEKDATLADNVRMTGTTRRVARIPDGQTLSGGGTVTGILRLDSGATYLAKQGEALTADGISVDASLEADITIDLPEDYTAGTPYLKANREERNVRARFLPVKETARWDSIAWIDTAVDTSKTTTYAARPPQVPAPTDYKDYVAGESPTTITGTIEGLLTQQYQNAGHAYIGATFGRTRAGTYALNPTELSDALLCFSNISAFVPASETQGTREYVDGTNFYVAYEFGISRQALVEIKGTEYVVLEVSVESAFDDGVSFPGVGFSDAQRKFVADFSSATELSFDLIDAAGKAQSLDSSLVEEVTDMDGTPVADTPGKRWFRIPYQDLLDQAPDGNIRLRASATSPYAEP